MFCPRCGQQLASQSIRFCANCGLRLDGVTYLLTNDGILPNQTIARPPEPTLKKRELRRGAKIFFSSFIALPLFGALCELLLSPAPILVPLTLFIAGVCWMLYAKIFCDDAPLPSKALPPQQNAQPVYFPPQPTYSAVPPPVRTAEIEPPPHSVIEHTTRQLGREKA
jgi:hypothetical protein